MQTDEIAALLIGATAMGSATIALFFYRFWTHTHDRLFAAFALAFGIFSASRVAASLLQNEDSAVWAYALRSVAFAIILVAIVAKNREGSAGGAQ